MYKRRPTKSSSSLILFLRSLIGKIEFMAFSAPTVLVCYLLALSKIFALENNIETSDISITLMKGVPYSISSQRLSGASYPCSADLIPSQGPSISLGYIQNNATCGDYERREFTITLPDGVPEVDMSLVLACADLTVKQPVTITSGAPVARHRRKRDMS